MKTIVRVLMTAILLVTGAIQADAAGRPVSTDDVSKVNLSSYADQFKNLKTYSIFNGRDLTGWEVMGENKQAFYVEDGLMHANGQGGFWIRYTEPVDNFILNLKYRLTPRANSGVFIRSTREGDPPYTGWEVQLLDTYGQRAGLHSAGAIYDVVKPKFENSRPAGEWNEMEIVADGPIVKVRLNGLEIIDVDLDDYDIPIGKFSVSLKDLPRSGYIGFQDHGNVLAFKDIYLTPLPSRD